MATDRPAPHPHLSGASGTPTGSGPGSAYGDWKAEAALSSLLELVSLDHLPRTGWAQRGIDPPESIAGHILGVAFVALTLAPRVTPELDLARVLSMALVHDAAEAVTGDLPLPAAQHLPPGAKHAMERSVAQSLLGPLSGTALTAFEDYFRHDTREARFVKQCDRVQLGVRLLAYETAGQRGLDEFWGGLHPEPSQPEAAAQGPEFPVTEEILSVIRGRRFSK